MHVPDPPSGGCEARRRRAALALGLAALLGCAEDPAPTAGAAPDADPGAVSVITAAVSRGRIEQRLSAPGSLIALRESRIGAEVRGRIEEVFVSEGERVAAGASLFRIDPQAYEVALRQAKAGLDLARAERRQIESDLARARTLLQKQVMSRQEIDRLETTLAVARARQRQAVEAVELAQFNLERTLVTAPYAGAVSERLADEGTTALVQPQTIVIVLQETHELEGRATIPEARLASVQVGDRARVRVQGMSEPIETRISAVRDAVDPATRTYQVKMRVPNPDHRLKAGVFAEFEILPAPRTGVLLVPREALRTEQGRTRVLMVREDVVVAVPVELGTVSSEAVEVRAGLSEGDRVIVGDAAQTLAPGMRVRVRVDGPDAS